MELAKLTSKGQITIPIQIRKKLKLKEGDSVYFVEDKGIIMFQNESQIALSDFQNKMTGDSIKANFQSEEDVISFIKTLRQQ